MAEIKPFKGILYNQKKVDNPKELVAPPYDVITPGEQAAYYNKHKNNVIRLILGKEYPSDTNEENKYTRAGGYFHDWQNSGVLYRDKRDSMYLYRQKYDIDGIQKMRDGFIALIKLENFDLGTILPHEGTFSSHKADRYELMKSCQANFSSIFSLYSDPEKKIEETWKSKYSDPPLIDIITEDKVGHELWRIDQPELIKKLTDAMNNKIIFIADGHHRYETALKYRDMMRKKNPSHNGGELYNYMMMYFTNMDSEGATILPVNRLVNNLPDFSLDDFLKKIEGSFLIEKFQFDSINENRVRKNFIARLIEKKDVTCFGISVRGVQCYYFLQLNDKQKIENFLNSYEKPIRDLDVIVLHDFLFRQILNIKEEDDIQIKYEVSRDQALDLVREGSYQMTFLINETKVEQVRAVAEAGTKMPKKSTFFYPKLLSGLVINKIVPDD